MTTMTTMTIDILDWQNYLYIADCGMENQEVESAIRLGLSQGERTQVSDKAKPAVLLMRFPRGSGKGRPIATWPFSVS
jgi:hypothetical protein